MFKFLVVASLVAVAFAQTNPAPVAAPTPSAAPGPAAPASTPAASFTPATPVNYALVTQYLTGSSSCSTGTNNQNVYRASISFGTYTPTTAQYQTGVCTNYYAGSVAYNYIAGNGTLQQWSYTAANCSGTPTVTALTTSCTNTTTANGFPSSNNIVALQYTSAPSLPGYLTAVLNGQVPLSATFIAAGVCLRVPNPTGASYNSTKVTCNGGSSAATQAYYSDNVCGTAYTAPPTTPTPVSPPILLPPSMVTVVYTCSNSGPPVAAPAPTPAPGGSTSPPGSPKAPGAPSSAATFLLSATATLAAAAALLL